MNSLNALERPERLRAVAAELRRVGHTMDPRWRPWELAGELDALAARVERSSGKRGLPGN